MFNKFLTAWLVSFSLMTSEASTSAVSMPEGYKAYDGKISIQWKPERNVLSIRFSTGCRSAYRASKLIENFDISFDQNIRKLDVSGGYILKDKPKTLNRKIRMSPKDCMGSRSKQFDIEDVELGPYLITRNGDELASAELSDEAQTFRFDRPGGALKTPLAQHKIGEWLKTKKAHSEKKLKLIRKKFGTLEISFRHQSTD